MRGTPVKHTRDDYFRMLFEMDPKSDETSQIDISV